MKIELLTIKMFVCQTCMNLFLLMNTKEYILKNFAKQTVDVSYWKSMRSTVHNQVRINCLVTNILQNISFFCSVEEIYSYMSETT